MKTTDSFAMRNYVLPVGLLFITDCFLLESTLLLSLPRFVSLWGRRRCGFSNMALRYTVKAILWTDSEWLICEAAVHLWLRVSDHLAIVFNLELPDVNRTSSHTTNYCKWRFIKPSKCFDYINSFLSCLAQSEVLEVKVLMLNSVVSSGLDLFSPVK